MTNRYGFVNICREAALTPLEADAAIEVLAHYAAYAKDLRLHMADGMSLSGYVLGAMIDDGKIAGISLTGDTLEQYSSSLASALRKIEGKLPQRSANPLAPIVI